MSNSQYMNYTWICFSYTDSHVDHTELHTTWKLQLMYTHLHNWTPKQLLPFYSVRLVDLSPQEEHSDGIGLTYFWNQVVDCSKARSHSASASSHCLRLHYTETSMCVYSDHIAVQSTVNNYTRNALQSRLIDHHCLATIQTTPHVHTCTSIHNTYRHM